MLGNVKELRGIYNMDKLKLIKLKLIAQQAIMWYGLLINGPMIAYIFYKTSEVKWIAGVCLLCGFGLISMISILWYKYFLSEELEFNSRLNPSWNQLLEGNLSKEELRIQFPARCLMKSPFYGSIPIFTNQPVTN